MIYVFEAKTRQFLVCSVLEVPPSGVPPRAWVDLDRAGIQKERLEPHVARQLAYTLLAAADVAEEEAEARRG